MPDADHERGERRVGAAASSIVSSPGSRSGRVGEPPSPRSPRATATAAVKPARLEPPVQTSANVAIPASAETITAASPPPDVSPS